jgi:hypothetical protein
VEGRWREGGGKAEGRWREGASGLFEGLNLRFVSRDERGDGGSK